LFAATAYYNQIASKKPKHNVVMQRFGDSDDDIQYEYISYNIDAPVSILLANSIECCNNSFGSNIKYGVCMQHNECFNLDTKSKEIWEQLNDKAKSVILGYDTRGSNSSFTPSKGVSNTNLLSQQKKPTFMTCMHMIYFRYMILRLTIQHQKWKNWMT
jgi:hypothetical protein